MDEKRILKFIGLFAKTKETFLNGLCYWFALILSERFQGRIIYIAVDSHFVTEINGNLYDVRGNVTDECYGKELFNWNNYQKIDPSHYARVVRDCVKKV